MSVSMTIGGVSASWHLSSFALDDRINQRSTCNFVIDKSQENDIDIKAGAQVEIFDNGTKIFGGTIDTFNLTILNMNGWNRYKLKCTDYNQICDRRHVARAYEDKTVSYIVNDIIDNYLADEGVTAGTIQEGPTLKKVVFNRKSVTTCLNWIKDATQLNWNIDYYKQLHIFYREDYTDLGFDVDNILKIQKEKTRDNYRNRQWIRAGFDTSDLIEKEWPSPKPDNNTRTFIMRFGIAKQPDLYINSIQVNTDDIGKNGIDENKKWYWNYNSQTITQDRNETPLSQNDILEVDYYGLFRILTVAENIAAQNNRAAIESGTGIYEEIEDQAAIDERQAAQDYADGLLRKYADIAEILNIQSRTFRQAGYVVPVIVNQLDIISNYLIESVSIRENNGYFFYNYKLLSGESLGSWIEFFRKLRKDGTDFYINEDEILIQLIRSAERINYEGVYTLETFDCLFPSNTLYPSEILYPGTKTSEVILYG